MTAIDASSRTQLARRIPTSASRSLSNLERFDRGLFDVLSTDLFDTVLLRDSTTETERLAIGCRRAARSLGIDPAVVTRLRWDLQVAAYRAVRFERPAGEAALSCICSTMAESLGIGADGAQLLRRSEVDVDIAHLRPNRPLVRFLDHLASTGVRVIAVSDTYYSADDLERILDRVVGPHPIAAIYSSADLGLTKHAGSIFQEVAGRENTPASRFLHVGDAVVPDVDQARAASWQVVHLPRGRRHRVAKLLGGVRSLPTVRRRQR